MKGFSEDSLEKVDPSETPSSSDDTLSIREQGATKNDDFENNGIRKINNVTFLWKLIRMSQWINFKL